MNAQELVKFLNVLRFYIPPYWRGRVDEVIRKIGGEPRKDYTTTEEST